MKNIIRTAITTPAIAGALLTGAPTAAAHEGYRTWRPCQYEDSINCVWDAKHMGNGIGTSYKVGRRGKVTILTHRRAHHLLAQHRDTSHPGRHMAMHQH